MLLRRVPDSTVSAKATVPVNDSVYQIIFDNSSTHHIVTEEHLPIGTGGSTEVVRLIVRDPRRRAPQSPPSAFSPTILSLHYMAVHFPTRLTSTHTLHSIDCLQGRHPKRHTTLT
ncbi:hypothetical protein N7519_002175 [Penicillium mononematosum]|uniref:uncharacterized protein n=1 Tax=Penicillium mononematosum TaxID=268346 RepID=UPI0025495015|nr:uncharacterized protein N7519_002175 [Penicillium mononematosum]KAJ6187267.1 hypothetical protein N7519_002175 [Penicillium mononematosum]